MKNRTGKSLLLLLAFLFFLPLNAMAAGITSSSYNASENLFYVYMDLTGVESFNILHEPTGEYKSYTAGSQNYITLNCNGNYIFTFFNSSSASMGSDSVTSSGIQNENSICQADSPTPEEPVEGGTCDSCAIMECPGWGEYMGKLDAIQAAIPPPPNWSQVADTFRDSIAPKIKQDMSDVIGVTATPSTPIAPSAPSAPSAPAQISAPSQPNAPSQPDPLSDRGIETPTGQEAPGLADSGFTADELENAAPEIEFNEDPTGGFTILNPTEGLPSQEEFRENAPIEEPIPLPSPPVGQETADEPDPVEEPVVTFPDINYDTAPTPAPGPETPTEPTFTGPTIDYENAPMPSTGTEKIETTEPTYSEPTGDYDTAPIPAPDGSTAPMPGGG